jgi:hypothetical protein
LLKELLLGLKLHVALFFDIRLEVEVSVTGLQNYLGLLVLGSPWTVTEIQLYAFDGAGRCCHGGWWVQTLIALGHELRVKHQALHCGRSCRRLSCFLDLSIIYAFWHFGLLYRLGLLLLNFLQLDFLLLKLRLQILLLLSESLYKQFLSRMCLLTLQFLFLHFSIKVCNPFFILLFLHRELVQLRVFSLRVGFQLQDLSLKSADGASLLFLVVTLLGHCLLLADFNCG